MDYWIHMITNNNKMGIIEARCLVKVKIDFSKEIFTYMVFFTFWPS